MSRIRMSGQGVLVTGCSSGIGRATAVYLVQAGFTVFATVRKEEDAEALRRLGEPGLVPVCPVDLSNPAHISAAVKFVTEGLRRRGQPGLYAIVNNAGGGVTAPIELMDLARFRTELEARIVGPVALLQALLPSLRQAQGRIVWITTPALLPIAYVSSIHVPDFAINCLVRTLRLELKQWRIPAIMVRCGTIQTAAPERSARELAEAMETWPEDKLALYRQVLEAQRAELGRLDAERTPAEDVAKVVCEALSASRPRPRYRVGRLAGLAATLELLPQSAVDYILSRRA